MCVCVGLYVLCVGLYVLIAMYRTLCAVCVYLSMLSAVCGSILYMCFLLGPLGCVPPVGLYVLQPVCGYICAACRVEVFMCCWISVCVSLYVYEWCLRESLYEFQSLCVRVDLYVCARLMCMRVYVLCVA
jgi:hypothetical protein